jgi:phenylpyruvate tautomerase PptA (4-oxalocrotonate tautomerase family)
MPLLSIKTNVQVGDRDSLAGLASKTTASVLGKPESYVMVVIEDQLTMLFAGNHDAAAYLEMKSIGLPEAETGNLSSSLCQLVSEQLQIEQNRIYIEFSNAERHMWGWNGSTF